MFESRYLLISLYFLEELLDIDVAKLIHGLMDRDQKYTFLLSIKSWISLIFN